MCRSGRSAATAYYACWWPDKYNKLLLYCGQIWYKSTFKTETRNIEYCLSYEAFTVSILEKFDYRYCNEASLYYSQTLNIINHQNIDSVEFKMDMKNHVRCSLVGFRGLSYYKDHPLRCRDFHYCPLIPRQQRLHSDLFLGDNNYILFTNM